MVVVWPVKKEYSSRAFKHLAGSYLEAIKWKTTPV